MATRANIKIIGESYQTTLLYRHCDGYPSELGAKLNDFVSNHGYEPIYTDAYAKEIIKSLGDDIEFTTCIHGDISYLYVIDLTKKTLECFKCEYEHKEYPKYKRTYNKVEL